MATSEDIFRDAMALPPDTRAKLAADLLNSLPGVLSDEDQGIAEALRRDAEIESNPTQAITIAQLDSEIQNRRG